MYIVHYSLYMYCSIYTQIIMRNVYIKHCVPRSKYICNIRCTLYSVQCIFTEKNNFVICHTLYNIQVRCALYSVHCTLCTVQCTLYIVHCTSYNVHRTLYIVHCTSYTVHHTLYTVHCTPYNVQCTMYYNIPTYVKTN